MVKSKYKREKHTVNKMLKLGYIEKVQDEQDKRVFWIQITEKGRHTFHKIHEEHLKYLDHLLSDFSEEEKLAFIDQIKYFGKTISDIDHVKNGMIIDFGDLKKIMKKEIVDVFDHATFFNKNTSHLALANELIQQEHKVILVNYQPTSEMMLIDFV